MKQAVCVLIVNSSEDFLSVTLKNDHTDFNLPGGTVEVNETLVQAGVREVKEETGIDIYENKLKFLHEDIDEDYVVTTYYTKTYNGDIHTTENHIVEWKPLFYLTKSKKWQNYNSIIMDKYVKTKPRKGKF